MRERGSELVGGGLRERESVKTSCAYKYKPQGYQSHVIGWLLQALLGGACANTSLLFIVVNSCYMIKIIIKSFLTITILHRRKNGAKENDFINILEILLKLKELFLMKYLYVSIILKLCKVYRCTKSNKVFIFMNILKHVS